MNRTAKITLGFGAYIIISASFMGQVRTFLINIFGENNVQLAFYILAFAVFVSYMLYLFRKKPSFFRMALSTAIFLLAYDLITRQLFFAEKLHIIEYGALGYLALISYMEADARILKSAVFSLLFVALVGALDEGFQAILPYRVFDLRDIATNIVSGLLGISLALGAILPGIRLKPRDFKAGFFFLILCFLLPAQGLYARQNRNYKDAEIKVETGLRPGMELKKIGGINALVPEGSQIYKKQGLIFLESPEEYAARRFKETGERFDNAEKRIEELEEALEALKEEVAELKPEPEPEPEPASEPASEPAE